MGRLAQRLLWAALALAAPANAADGAAAKHERRAPEMQEVDVFFGAMNYTETNVSIDLPGGDRDSDPVRTRGDWLELQAQYDLLPWLALGVRARAGHLFRGPVTSIPADKPVMSGDFSVLDPQLGDPRFGGAVAPMIRFLPGHTALDAGLTFSFGPFRPRYPSSGPRFAETCGDCYHSQSGFSGVPVLPTFRVSRTGEGFVYAFSTGEGFVHTNEPVLFEALLGGRSGRGEVLAGLGRGLALRADAETVPDLWLGLNLSVKPWGRHLSGQEDALWIVVFGLERRWSSFAPM